MDRDIRVVLTSVHSQVRAWLSPISAPQELRLGWPAIFRRQDEAGDEAGPRLAGRAILVDWLILLVLIWSYCSGFLDLGTRRALPGNEAEIVQSLDWTLVNSLTRYGQFPLWNPHLQTGLPFIADPFQHVFNPLSTLPVLLFGVMDGFKVALFLSFLAAALGMWWLGVVLGVGRASRLWMGAMYAFTGQGVARFFQGEYDFVLGFAWLPWALASLLLAGRTRRRPHAVLAVISMALVFFSGNVYYAYYLLFVAGLLALVMAFGVGLRKPYVVFHWARAKVLIVVGLLTLALVAVQLLPLVEFWPHITKVADPKLAGSHTIQQIFLDFLSTDTQRADAIKTLPREEFYAYTGLWPFLALVLLPLAFWKRDRRPLVFFVLLFLFTVGWIDSRDMPWRDLYARAAFLNQFRYPTRMLIFGALSVIALAGVGLDTLWRLAGVRTRLQRMSVPDMARWAGARAGLALLAVLLIWSAADVYSTNRQHARTRDPYDVSYEIMRWLREADPGEFYVGNPNGWHGAIISNNLRYVDAWYGFSFIPPTKGAINRRAVLARPNYIVMGNDQRPNLPDPAVVRRFEGHTVWKLPHSLPFAFTVTNARLGDVSAGRELWADDVVATPPRVTGPNSIEITAEGAEGASLVVLMQAYQGWRVTVDGRPAALRNVGGYLAVAMAPGAHTYAFSYSPRSFWIGLTATLLALLALAALLAGDWVLAQLPRPGRRIRTAAVYATGVLTPAKPLPLPENAAVQLTVTLKPEPRPGPMMSLAQQARRLARWEWVLCGLGLFVYLATRLWAMDKFPIYFFADEATHAVLAQDLLDRGLRDGRGNFFPLYFEAAGLRWTPLLSVYVHAISVALFGKTVFITRATGALVSLLAAGAAALILKWIFKARYWWVGALLMAAAPAWFLHSRTGFETVMMSSFFLCTVLCYMLYRTRSPRYLFATLLFGAATFYTYSNGQMIIAALAALLLISDIRYHLRNWRTLLLAAALAFVLMQPALNFRTQQPNSLPQHLRAIDSYWFRALPLETKVSQFITRYTYGLSPAYWFFPNERDLARHRMKGYGNLPTWELPLLLVGVALCLWRVRSSPHRSLLLAAAATPVGAALVDITITRVLAFVGPATVLAGLGLDALLGLLTRRPAVGPSVAAANGANASAAEEAAVIPRRGLSLLNLPYRAGAVVVFLLLASASVGMTRDALANGPLWHSDYGLYGMQYGAKQLFEDAIPAYLRRDPKARLMLTSTWANGADTFIRFFLPPEQRARVQMLNVDFYLNARRDLNPNIVLIMTPSEYDQARTSPKFKTVTVEHVIPYPDGRPGFYFARLAYADTFDALLAAERAQRSKPVAGQVQIDGQNVQVSHSQLDMGQLRDLFDGDLFTLARGREANPLVFEFTFAQPRPMTGLAADFGSMDFSLTAKLFAPETVEPITYAQTYRGLPPDPHAELAFDKGPPAVARLRLEILQLNAGDEAHIHVRELKFK